AVMLALIAAPAWLVGRRLRPGRSNPLAWRLIAVEDGAPPARSRHRVADFVRRRAHSFAFAGAGIWHVARKEPSAWIHAVATVVALGAAIVLGISARDWRWIALAIVAVWSAEAVNTAIQHTYSLLRPQ